MLVHFMVVFDCVLILLRLTLWLSAEIELSSWLSACVALLYAVSVVCVPFLFGVWDRVWNSIASVYSLRPGPAGAQLK